MAALRSCSGSLSGTTEPRSQSPLTQAAFHPDVQVTRPPDQLKNLSREANVWRRGTSRSCWTIKYSSHGTEPTSNNHRQRLHAALITTGNAHAPTGASPGEGTRQFSTLFSVNGQLTRKQGSDDITVSIQAAARAVTASAGCLKSHQEPVKRRRAAVDARLSPHALVSLGGTGRQRRPDARPTSSSDRSLSKRRRCDTNRFTSALVTGRHAKRFVRRRPARQLGHLGFICITSTFRSQTDETSPETSQCLNNKNVKVCFAHLTVNDHFSSLAPSFSQNQACVICYTPPAGKGSIVTHDLSFIQVFGFKHPLPFLFQLNKILSSCNCQQTQLVCSFLLYFIKRLGPKCLLVR